MRILRGLTSRLLPCGCVAGIYETYDAEVVTLLDERHPGCLNSDHVDGNRIPELAPASPASKVTLHTERQRQS